MHKRELHARLRRTWAAKQVPQVLGTLALVLFATCSPGSVIWSEGESAATNSAVPNAGLDALDPQELSGAAWLSSFANGDQPTGMAEYHVAMATSGTYRLWVRGTGALACRIGDRPWLAADPAKATGHLSIAADGNPAYPTIGWFDMGDIALTSGAQQFVWRLGAADGAARYGAIDCFVLADEPFAPRDNYKPGEQPPLVPAFKPGATWNFNPAADTFDPAARLDLRGLNEPAAGDHGFIACAPDGESFVRGDGQPIRFWAIGLRTTYRGGTLPELQHLARFLAKRGVNAARIFAMLPPDTPGTAITNVNERELDAVFKLVAALKSAGIYSIVCGYWGSYSTVQPGWDVMDSGGKTLATLVYYDPKTQAAYKAWLAALLTRVNPYTGVTLADEPAVAVIQLQNEDNLLWHEFSHLKGEALMTLRRLYAAFLARNYGSVSNAFCAWKNYQAQYPPDDVAQGLPGFLHNWDLTSDGWAAKGHLPGFAERTASQLEFIARLTRQFNQAMIDYLRKDLRCRQLINAGNWQTVDLSTTMDAQYWADSAADVMARNIYSGGRHYGINCGWQIMPGHRYSDVSLLTRPQALPTNVKQLAGHPYILPEALWTPPNLYQAEAALLVAGQQSLAGVDAACWFSNFPDEWVARPGEKWTFSTPLQLGQFPAAALLYRTGLLRPGAPAVVEHRALENLWQRTMPLLSEDPGWDPNRHMGLTLPGNQAAVLDPLAYLVGPVRLVLDSDPAKTTVVPLERYIDTKAKVVRSITGEIETDYGAGVYRINAPAAQGAVGFLKAAGTQRLADVTIACDTPYASVMAVALDGKPLRSARSVLVQMGTVARPTGWTTRPARVKEGGKWINCARIISAGALPWQVEKLACTLSVANPALTRASVLDANGMPSREPVNVRTDGTNVHLVLPPDALYLVLENEPRQPPVDAARQQGQPL